MMTSNRSTRLALLIHIVVIVGVVVVNAIEEDNELLKICRPIDLRLHVLFLLDGSGSVSGSTFSMQMKVLDKIASMMNIGENKSQIAVLQYASYTRLEHSFDDYQSHDDLQSSLRKIHHMSGTTKTGKAMLKALDMFRKAKRKENSDISQVAVVVTDGHSQDNPVPAAEALRAAGVTILTLGIGDHINRDEIVRISGKDELAFQNLHKNVSLEHFVAGFKNLSQGEHCEYARGVDGAEITCGPDFVQVGISTTKKLKGRLFFEGYHHEPGCTSTEDHSQGDQDESRFDVRTIAPHGKCGLIKTYEAKSRGFVVSSRAVLQFDRRFATANDHSFEIRCFYPDKTKTVKTSNRMQGVTTLVTEAVLSGSKELLSELTEAMKCRYTVTPQPEQCSSHAITVGTPLLHVWRCDSDHPRFRVHSCFTVDPVSHRIEMVIDHNGCITQPSIINSLDYSKDGIVTGVGKAVRFADVPILKFSCKLRLCNPSDEQCSPVEAPHCRTKRETLDNEASSTKDAEEYDNYDDDNIEERMPDPQRAAMAVTEEPSTTVSLPSVFGHPSRASVVPLRSASSVIASGFPSGGIDMRLNAKSMAVVDTEHARDRLKQALQRRASSLPIETVAERLTSVNVQHGVGTRKVLKVVKTNRSALQQSKSHVRQLPTPLTTQELHQQLIMSSSTEEPPTVSPTTQEAIEELEEVGSSIDLETTPDESIESTSTTTYAPAPTTLSSSTSTTSTHQPVPEDISDNEIEEEVVVVSDTIVIRLPHETFVTGCNKNDQC